jgi:hypothetical protein
MKDGPAKARAGEIPRAAFSLAWKCGVATIAISWIASMLASPRRFPGVDLPKRHEQSVISLARRSRIALCLDNPIGERRNR